MENNQKILSVSIAAYNVQETLKEALEPFVKSKKLNQIDVMIIDDGSSDDTSKIASEYVEKYPNSFRVFTKANGGWGSTLNVGMKNAIGKYFKQLDGDDYYSTENLDDFIEFLDSCTADMVYAPFITFNHTTGAIIRVIGAYTCYPFGINLNLSEMQDFAPAMHTITIRTEILKKNPIHITEHCFYTDVEFVLKTCNFCRTITFYEMPIYYYRLARAGQSMSVQGVRKHYLDHLKMLTTMLEYEQTFVKDPGIHEIYFIRLKNACNMQYLFFFALQCNRKQKQELIAFDKMLKERFPKYYEAMGGNQIRLLRKTHFWGYRLIGHEKTRKDRKLKQNVFEGA